MNKRIYVPAAVAGAALVAGPLAMPAAAAPAPAGRAPAAAASLARPAAAGPQGLPFQWEPSCDSIPARSISYGVVCTVTGTPWTATGILQSTTQAVWCLPGFNHLDAWTVVGDGRRTDAATLLYKNTDNPNPPYTTPGVEGRLVTITNLSSGKHTYTPALDCVDNYIPPIPKPGS